ncbi:hypothetical protein [Mesorhizobium sp. M0276]|uniref:hypothetical protein n=1 Tax=Mesorhizobium sp. M0276 TaxID=2956928 RepID=UPI00333716BF
MKIALTEDLVAKIDRKIDDAGPAPGQDHDYLDIRRRLLAGRPRDVWVTVQAIVADLRFEGVQDRERVRSGLELAGWGASDTAG